MAALYLILAVLGTVVPYWPFVRFLAEHGPDASGFVEQLFATRASTFFALDLLMTALVVWVFVFSEGGRQRMRHLWVYVLCTLLVGVSLALPLFLYMRERQTRQSIWR